MNTKQDYIDIYRKIAENLGIYGDQAEILIQLLAESTYISEVEHVVYAQESSLEKAALLNSKIQHCMNDMYSVYRGSCPRVIFRFRPTKYFNLEPFSEIITGNGFKVYYLGYWTGETKVEPGMESVALMTGFTYGPKIIPPSLSDDVVYTIVGLLAQDTSQNINTTTDINTYYVENTDEDLSSDMWAKVDGKYWPVSRNFSQHITESYIYDLTLSSFGSRLYVADILRSGAYSRTNIYTQTNVEVEALWFKYSLLSDYNQAELKKMVIRGTVPVSFGGEFQGSTEVAPGIILIEESSRDTLTTIHYKANRDRYVNSIIRTNSDIGTILEEFYPDNVKAGGTSYRFFNTSSGSGINLYYVPQDQDKILTEEDIEEFRINRGAYYVTDNMVIQAGTVYTAIFNLDLELYQSESIDDAVGAILSEYEDKFNMNLEEKSEEIKSLISKISNVKQISGYSIDYLSESGNTLDAAEKAFMLANLDTSYYKINYIINSKIQTVGV